MAIVAGIDLGGTAVNYTLLDSASGQFLVQGLCEHPALASQGPDVCLQQIADGLEMAARRAGTPLADIVAIGLDTPGPASATGVLSARGSTNFAHAAWAGFDLRGGLAERLKRPVVYLNDGNAAALWGHTAVFGSDPPAHERLRDHRHRHGRWSRRRRTPGQRPQRIRRGSRPRADSVAIDRRPGGSGAAVQLRPHRGSRVPLLADRHPADAAAAHPPAVSRIIRCTASTSRRPLTAFAAWPTAATRWRARSSASRRARSGCSSIRW